MGSEMVSGHDRQAAVVLVNCVVDGGELAAVHDVLTRWLSTPTVLIGPADLACLHISLDLGTGVLDLGGRRLRPHVVWLRHASACAMVARSDRAATPLHASSWWGLLQQLSASAGTALPGHAPVGPLQLGQAERLGVTVPRTVITTDVAGAARQLGARRVIVKTPDFRLFEPDRQSWPDHWPAIVDGRAAASDPAASDPAAGRRPVVVQEYVEHAQELRVYFLNGGICAFDVRKPEPSSLWTDPDNVTVTRVDCPPVAAAAVRVLSAAWGLRFGAFDLLVTHAGELVFLEVNPDGDWLFYERRARWHGVSFMAAVMLREVLSSVPARRERV